MASTGPPPPGGDPPGKKSNPFDILRMREEDVTPDGVKRAYRNLMLNECHPDKHQGKEELAVKVNLAYDQLKNKEEEELKAKWKEYQGAAGFLQQQPDGTTLSNVLEDKTLSEHFRRLKKALEMVAKETKFKDNFKEYYKQIFDNVEGQPEVKGGNNCAVCKEEVIHRWHHEQVVYEPYFKFVLGEDENRKGLEEYLKEAFDEEERDNWIMPEDVNGDVAQWVEEYSKLFFKWCDRLKPHPSGDLHCMIKDEDDDTREVLTCLISGESLSVEQLCKNLNDSREETTASIEMVEADVILPAYLHATRNFKDWLLLSNEVVNYSPRTALALICAYKAINPAAAGENDPFFSLGDAIIKSEQDLGYAHVCFLLGSCDLFEVANRIMELSKDLGCRQLAAFYFCRTGKWNELVNLGKAIMEENKEDVATECDEVLAAFYLCLLEPSDIDAVIRGLGQILPSKWHWKYVVQALLVDFPDLVLHSTAVAGFALIQVYTKLVEESQENGNPLRELMKLMGALKSSKMLSQVASGALHMLFEDEQRYGKGLKAIHDAVKQIMDMKLTEGDAGFLLGLARVPEITTILEETLTKARFLGENQVTPTPGVDYYACLFILRAMYHLKHHRYTQMADDLVSAAEHTGKSDLCEEIAEFLTSNPLLHEKLIKISSRQFEQLQAYIDDYSGDPLEESNFLQVLQKTCANIQPYLSEVFKSCKDDNNEPDIGYLEQNTLDRNPQDFVETALSYVDLLAICNGTLYEKICCITMAAHFFLKAMLATPEEDIVQKYGFHGLILECIKKLEGLAGNIWVAPVPTALHAVRTLLSFQFTANQHFSQILIRNQQHAGVTKFIDEGDAPNKTELWQRALNLRTVCPVVCSEIWTIAEGRLAMRDMDSLWISSLKGKVKWGLYSDNTPEFMHHQLLFNTVWAEHISPEATGYEIGIAEGLVGKLEELKLHEEKDGDQEKKKVEDLLKETKEFAQTLEEMPLVERPGFETSRANSMVALAKLYGYDLADVEAMLNWSLIRRTSEGWLDMENTSLNFEQGQQTFSQFVGFEMDVVNKTFQLLLVPAVKGDPNRPELFSSVDLMEIFGNRICAAYLSFDEQPIPSNVPEYVKLTIPFHPFFKVRYVGATPSGANKESICGTNFLMTLYHLDLLAKIFTTGQEISANFPFKLRSTKKMLKELDKKLRELLQPVGERKKAVHLQMLELIHRFWFAVGEIEQELVVPTLENPCTTITAKFGSADLALKTMPMVRGESGELKDDEDQFDEQSPEVRFVRGFNENMDLIEKKFPLIMRLKELGKIMACVQMLHNKKDAWEELVPAVKQVTELQLPPVRPYSKCGQVGSQCKCCNWVPAVFGKTEVTPEQKLEYIFDKYGAQVGRGCLEGVDEVKRLMFHQKEEEDGQNIGNGDADASSKATTGDHEEDDARKDEEKGSGVDTKLYDRLERYRIYGGVEVYPKIRSVNGLASFANLTKFGWQMAFEVGAFGARTAAAPTGSGASFEIQSMKSSGRQGGGGRGPGGGGKGGGGNKKKKRTRRRQKRKNGNRLDNPRPTFVYLIMTDSAHVHTEGANPEILRMQKPGISSGKLKADGTLPRAQKQVDALNNHPYHQKMGIRFKYEILQQFSGRMPARSYEAWVSNTVRAKYGSFRLPMERGAHPERYYKDMNWIEAKIPK